MQNGERTFGRFSRKLLPLLYNCLFKWLLRVLRLGQVLYWFSLFSSRSNNPNRLLIALWQLYRYGLYSIKYCHLIILWAFFSLRWTYRFLGTILQLAFVVRYSLANPFSLSSRHLVEFLVVDLSIPSRVSPLFLWTKQPWWFMFRAV